METILEIDGHQVRFKAAASFVYRYKAQFGKDVLTVLLPMVATVMQISGENTGAEQAQKIIEEAQKAGLELTDIYNIIWVMAKTADESIPEPMAWLDGFDQFPLADIAPALLQLLVPSIITSKEAKKKPTKQAVTSL